MYSVALSFQTASISFTYETLSSPENKNKFLVYFYP